MINKITIKNGVKIINDEFVKKKKKREIDNIYNYLLSRSFDYFPEVLNEDDEYIYYRYINDIDEPREQKMVDLVNLVSLLHNKTTFYKEVDIDVLIKSEVTAVDSSKKTVTYENEDGGRRPL